MSEDTFSRPSLLGQLLCIAWIGQHPADGGDFPMLLTYSPADGALGPDAAQPALREVIDAWGMREGTMVENPVIEGRPVTASLSGDIVTITGFPGLDITRPTSPEWAAIANQRRQLFLSITTRPWPEGPTAAQEETSRFMQDERTIRSAVALLLPVI
ncbi:DUF5949 family protein [Streptomyces goshikiensis]|uniref:DUF5949 family protein n=1 Tax=Streptomyces goshikiensis TaxID=1942 RepID=UPI0036C9736D